MPDETLHQHLVRELKVIRRSGLHRLRAHLGELPYLVELTERTMGAGHAQDVEGLLRAVYTQRSEGAQGTGIGILLGLEQGRRGASPTVLRQIAAVRLGYHSVDTFRKRPEEVTISTFAHLIESFAIDLRNRPELERSGIETILELIERLTLAEYGELVRRLRRRISTVADEE